MCLLLLEAFSLCYRKQTVRWQFNCTDNSITNGWSVLFYTNIVVLTKQKIHTVGLGIHTCTSHAIDPRLPARAPPPPPHLRNRAAAIVSLRKVPYIVHVRSFTVCVGHLRVFEGRFSKYELVYDA